MKKRSRKLKKKFAKALVRTNNATKAARMVGISSPNKQGPRLAKDAEVLAMADAEMAVMMKAGGVTPERLGKKIGDLLDAQRSLVVGGVENAQVVEVDDVATQLDAVELVAKMKGMLRDRSDVGKALEGFIEHAGAQFAAVLGLLMPYAPEEVQERVREAMGKWGGEK